MGAPVVVVVRCVLTLRKECLQVRRQISLSAKAARVEVGSVARSGEQDQQQQSLVLAATRLMGVPAAAGGRPLPAVLEVQTEAEEAPQLKGVRVEVAPVIAQPTTFFTLARWAPTDPHLQWAHRLPLTTVVVVVVVLEHRLGILAIKRMEWPVEQEAVGAVLTTGFVKAVST